jgi:pimeloyl-ACP methyl ester carboxylesterase
MDQSIRFCTTDDGVRIAYATSGKGPPIVRPGHWLTHLEYDLKSPVWRPLLMGLSEQHTLVRYDPRGTGMSDRDVRDVSLDLWLKDLEAVVGDLGLDRFALLGMSQGGPVAIRYAAKHPDKVTHLILYGSYARRRLPGDDVEFSPEMLDAMCTLILKGWGSDNESYRELFSSRYVGSGNREHIRWFNELEAISASPEMAARYLRALSEIDVRDILPKVKAPTLVLHCRGDRVAPFRFGRELAAGIAGAKFVPMEGDNHVFLEHAPASGTFFLEVSRFLGDKRPLVSKVAVGRHARNWRALISRVHHAVEPYYVIAAVVSLAIGAISYLVARFGWQ